MMAEDSPNATAFAGTIDDAEQANGLCDVIERAMEGLIATIEEETDLVRHGKMREASALQPRKAGLSDIYVKAILYARRQAAALKRFAPEATARLERRHGEFKALLRINMAVLSTAREVSEELVRNVARTVGKAERPSTYGRKGTAESQPGVPLPGMAYDRTG